jgi:copper oxidase (laccase) domain-containing protein
LLFEQFSPLTATGICLHAFTRRVPGIDVAHGKAEVLPLLEQSHREVRTAIGADNWPLLTAEQVHSNKIAVIDEAVHSDQHFAGCDGLITNQRKVALGVHVADCCAVYIVDPKTPAIGLVHSGKKGTEVAIVAKAIAQLHQHFGSNPADLIVQLSPCIRPPHYQVDFAAEIRKQARAAGVKQVHDSEVCTACDLDSYYSYRAEKGKTGRMLAVLGLL